eukprot:sb/3464831/
MLARFCLGQSLSVLSGKRALSAAAAAPVPAPAQDEEDGLIGVSENVRSIADQICNLSLIETGHLTKVLKSRLGIGDIAIGAAAPAASAPAAVESEVVEEAPPVEEKKAFTVKLISVDASKKLFEKLLFWNVDWDLNITSRLADQQLGFRRGNSTGLAALKALLKIHDALEQKNYCLGLFLDFARAFDTVSPKLVMSSLATLGVPPDILGVFNFYYENRKVTVSMGATTVTLTGLDGTLAGEISSPFCWNAATRELVIMMLARFCLRRSLSVLSGKRALSAAAAAPVPAPAQDEEDGLIGVSENVRSIADQICNLSLIETGHLTKVLKSRLGIGDIAIGAAAPAASAPAAVESEVVEEAPPVEEKKAFTVKLISVDASKKIKLIKAIKESVPNFNLVAAKKLVESAPCIVREDVPTADAEKLQAALTEFGAEVILE